MFCFVCVAPAVPNLYLCILSTFVLSLVSDLLCQFCVWLLGMCTQAVVTLFGSNLAFRISVLAGAMRGGSRLLSRGSSTSPIHADSLVDNPSWYTMSSFLSEFSSSP